MDLFTSDLHFGHENAVRFDHRPFIDATDMFEKMKKLWNDKVNDNDDVWILGDVTCGNIIPPEQYISQLRGRKHLIYGNHDRNIIMSPEAQALFVECCHLRYLQSEGRVLFLSHYPIADWYGMRHGSFHIYGHIHTDTGDVYKFMTAGDRGQHAFNAGCMINGYAPVSFEELVENNLRFREQEASRQEE